VAIVVAARHDLARSLELALQERRQLEQAAMRGGRVHAQIRHGQSGDARVEIRRIEIE
jgi:hypothetical protein